MTFPLRIGSAGVLLLGLGFSGATFGQAPTQPMGPLAVHPDNPRYFQNTATGEAVYLTGSHVWYNLVDMGPDDPPEPFDFDAYLDWLEQHQHNFIRLWAWDSTTWDTSTSGWKTATTHFHVAPQPWQRTGPGRALDDKPKFDLTQYDPAYFERLRDRVQKARDRGLYVAVMLFEGWGMQFAPGAWESHPFHPENNVNGIDIDIDADGDGKALEVYTLADPAVTALQEAYVRQVIETVGDLDNVLYEISNENHPGSTEWQYHLIRFIKAVERERPRQHPVGMTFQYRGGSNQTLFDSPADWISPNPEGGYRDDPPVNDGRKVVLNDTDHLWGIGGNPAWVWKSFLRGHHPIFMDPYDGVVLGQRFDPQFDPVRRSMGQTRRFAERLNLAAMTPQDRLASSGYCLAHAGQEYLVYLPESGEVTVDLSGADGWLAVEWFHPDSDQTQAGEAIRGGDSTTLTSPFEDGDVVLCLKASR